MENEKEIGVKISPTNQCSNEECHLATECIGKKEGYITEDKNKSITLSRKQFEIIINKLYHSSANIRKIILTGGEPLELSPEFLHEIINIIKSCHYDVYITTSLYQYKKHIEYYRQISAQVFENANFLINNRDIEKVFEFNNEIINLSSSSRNFYLILDKYQQNNSNAMNKLRNYILPGNGFFQCIPAEIGLYKCNIDNIFIDEKGQVFACSGLYQQSNLPVGNIFQESFSDIYQRIIKIQKKYKENRMQNNICKKKCLE